MLGSVRGALSRFMKLDPLLHSYTSHSTVAVKLKWFTIYLRKPQLERPVTCEDGGGDDSSVPELLQERALEAGVLSLLTQCIQQHPEDEDLVNMALATFISVADSDAGKSRMMEGGVLDTVVGVVAREDCSEPVKNELADSSLPTHLIQVIHNNAGQADPDNGSMEKLYGGGEGLVFKQCIKWLESDVDSLRVLGALAIGNFARSDAHCRQLVDSGIVDSLLVALKPCSASGDNVSFTLQHAVLSSLRNLAIPASNKGRLLEAGVVQAVLDLKHTEMMAVAFKLLGVLRMLMDGQEAAAISLGQERDFLNCLVDWCAVEEHAGVKGEAAVSLRESDLVGTVVKILKSDDTVPELLCNTLTLVRTLATADSLKQEMITSGLLDHIRHLTQTHPHQGVKDTARSALTSLEDELASQ
nr:hypothetical protein BaRGS_005059 [Batillaria attramentaria]